MNKEYYYSLIRKMIYLEEIGSCEAWLQAETIALDAINSIDYKNPENNEIYKFFDDVDIRRSDKSYREYQTKKIKSVMNEE